MKETQYTNPITTNNHGEQNMGHDHDFNFDDLDKGELLPLGEYPCVVKLGEYKPLGKNGNGTLGWRFENRVLSEEYLNRTIRDSMNLNGRAGNRVYLICKKLAGVEHGPSNTAQVRELLQGRLAWVKLDKISTRAQGSFDELTEEQAAAAEKDGATIYREAKVAWNGYRPMTDEEASQYSAAAADPDADMPWGNK
jgi:hypothetical protein